MEWVPRRDEKVKGASRKVTLLANVLVSVEAVCWAVYLLDLGYMNSP